MSANGTCSYTTKRGKPCRASALANTSPPACRHHRDRGPSRAAADLSFYLRDVTDDEAAALASAEMEGLSAELALVRIVLRRLMARLDDPAYALLPDDLRKLAGLIFTGARTAARLLAQREGSEDELPAWLAGALDELNGAEATRAGAAGGDRS